MKMYLKIICYFYKNMEKYITKFEKTRVIGLRATQLADGAPSTIDITKFPQPISAMQIAEEEFRQKKIPLVIHRSYPGGKIKKIPVNDLMDLE